MKNLIKIFVAFLIMFVGISANATPSQFFNPNLEITEVRASHVLVKTRKEAVQIKKDIESGKITFEQAAEQYSLCPSGQYGGDLGFFNRKQMVQQFADTAFDLKVGEISDPVGTKFGWHIIKTTAKR
jgi:peptidyl-prolyl cis-trans isomerase C